ncbi:hypothetical protein Ga0466249_002413 [Sporomusaceae bacterium BoRhaA]|uniref:hypothetical protein n=1 Tax=Pelorhabdus rhamnosifermentans TaxID=2772457 RepID=UPI001C05F826|nr:hypothetical protein [Pelorhabdus rhamnosifermentans]MBU2701299.1 hypothetical protein [Pelorhabdus rhamnosifermentans]
MNESQKWYLCRRDIGVTLVITLFAFLTNPIISAYQILHIRDDMGILGGLTITVFVLVESLLIRTQHYWKWIVLSTFFFTAAAYIRGGFSEFGTVLSTIAFIIANGAIFLLLFAIPASAIVYFLKKKIKYGFSLESMKDSSTIIIFIALIWELLPIWIIFGK